MVYKQAWIIKNYRYIWDVSFTASKHLFPYYMSNPLFIANRWDWQPHHKLGQSSLVVLCAGSTLLLAPTPRTRLSLVSLPKSASNNLQKWILSPTGRLNLGFILRENLLLCASYLPLGVSQLVLWDIKTFFGAVAGEKEDFCKGSLSLPIFLLCYCFA
jgi:hypothetical protein